MLLNKRMFNKVGDRKTLRKSRGRWITVSLALISAIGAAGVSTKISHAQANGNSDVDNGARTQVNHSLQLAYQRSENAQSQPSSSTTLAQFANSHRLTNDQSAESITVSADVIANQHRIGSLSDVSNKAKQFTADLMSKYVANCSKKQSALNSNNGGSNSIARTHFNLKMKQDNDEYNQKVQQYNKLMSHLAGDIKLMAIPSGDNHAFNKNEQEDFDRKSKAKKFNSGGTKETGLRGFSIFTNLDEVQPASGNWGDTNYSLSDNGTLTISSYVTSSDATGYNPVSVPVTAYSNTPETEYSNTPETLWSYEPVTSYSMSYGTGTSESEYTSYYTSWDPDAPFGWNYAHDEPNSGAWVNVPTDEYSLVDVPISSDVPVQSESQYSYTSWYESAYTSYYPSAYTSYTTSESAYTYTSYTTHSDMQQGSNPLDSLQQEGVQAVDFQGVSLPTDSSGMFSGMNKLSQITTDNSGLADTSSDNLASISPNGWRDTNNGSIVPTNQQLQPNTTYQVMPRYFADYKFGDHDLGKHEIFTTSSDVAPSHLTVSVNGNTYALDPRSKVYQNGGPKGLKDKQTYTIQLDQVKPWGTAKCYITPSDTKGSDYEAPDGKPLEPNTVCIKDGMLGNIKNEPKEVQKAREIDFINAKGNNISSDFANRPNLSDFNGGGLDTSDSSDMHNLFKNDPNLKSVTLGNTEKAKMNGAFTNDPKLDHLTLSSNTKLTKSDGLSNASDWFNTNPNQSADLSNVTHPKSGEYDKGFPILINYYYNKKKINSTKVPYDMFWSNSHVVSLKTPTGYHLTSNRENRINRNWSQNISVSPDAETDTLHYFYGKTPKGTGQMRSYYDFSGKANSQGLNSDFELAGDGTSDFTFTGTSHHVDVKHIPETDDVEYVYNGDENEGSDTMRGVKGQGVTITGNGLKQDLGNGFKLANDGTQNFKLEGTLHDVDVVPAKGKTVIVGTGYWTPDNKNDDGKASKWTLDNYGNLVINGGQMERTAFSTKSDYPTGLKTDQIRSIKFINRPKAPQWMAYLFENLPHLIKVNFRDLKIDNSRDTAYLLANDPHLISVKMPKIIYNGDKYYENSADGMFAGDTNLKYIDLSGLNTQNVATMANEIGGDRNLVYLKLGPHTTNLDKIDHKEANQTLFSTVAKADAPKGWKSIAGFNRGKVVTDGKLLPGNTWLNVANAVQAAPLQFTWYDTSSGETVNASDSTVNGSLYMPVDANDYLPIGYKLDPKAHYEPDQINYLLTNKPQKATINVVPDSMVDYGFWSYDDKDDNHNTAHWSIDNQGNLNIYGGIMEPLTTQHILGKYANDITSINIFGLYGKVISPTNMTRMFANLPNLRSINTDVNGFTTKQAKQWSHAFYNDPKLVMANLSSFDIDPGPTGTLDNMFSNDKNLTYVDLSNLNTSDTNMDNFFGGKNLRNETDHADSKLAFVKLGENAFFDNAIDDDNALGEDPIDVLNSDAPQGWQSLTGANQGMVVENGLLKPSNSWFNIAHAVPGAPIIFRWYDAVNHKRVTGPDDTVKGIIGMPINASDYLPNGYILDPDKMYTPDQTNFTVGERLQSPLLYVVPDKNTDKDLTSANVTYKFGNQTLGKTQVIFNHGYNVSDVKNSDLTYSDNGVNYALDPRTRAYRHGIEMINGRNYTVQLDRAGAWNNATYYLTPSDADTPVTRAYGKGNLLLADGTLGENSDVSDSDSAIAQDTDLSDTKPIRSITFDSGVYAPSDAEQLFTKLPNLVSVNTAPHGMHQTSGLQLTHTHNISGIFMDDPKLKSIDLSSWKTKKLSAKAMQNMVASDPQLQEVELGHMTAMKSSGKITPGYTGTWMTNGGAIVNMNHNLHPKHEWYSKAMPTKVTFAFGIYPESTGTVMYNPSWGEKHNLATSLMPKVPKGFKLYHSNLAKSYQVNRDGSTVIQVAPLNVTDRGTWGQDYWKLTSDGTLHLVAGPNGDHLQTNQWPDTVNNAINKSDVKQIVFSDTVALPSDASGIFSGLKNLSNFRAANLDSTNTKNLSRAFASDVKLNRLDLSNLTAPKLTDMHGMFAGDGLKSLDIPGIRNNPDHDSDAFRGDFRSDSDTLRFNPNDLKFDAKSGLNGDWMSIDTYKNDATRFSPRPLASDDDLGTKVGTWKRVNAANRAQTVNFINQDGNAAELGQMQHMTTGMTVYRPLAGSRVTLMDQLKAYNQQGVSGYTINPSDDQLTYDSGSTQVAKVTGISEVGFLPVKIILDNGVTKTVMNQSTPIMGKYDYGRNLTGKFGDVNDAVDANEWNSGLVPAGYQLSDGSRGLVNGKLYYNINHGAYQSNGNFAWNHGEPVLHYVAQPENVPVNYYNQRGVQLPGGTAVGATNATLNLNGNDLDNNLPQLPTGYHWASDVNHHRNPMSFRVQGRDNPTLKIYLQGNRESVSAKVHVSEQNQPTTDQSVTLTGSVGDPTLLSANAWHHGTPPTSYQLETGTNVDRNNQAEFEMQPSDQFRWTNGVPTFKYRADPEHVTVNYFNQAHQKVGTQILNGTMNLDYDFQNGNALRIPQGYVYDASYQGNPTHYRFSSVNEPLTVHVTGTRSRANDTITVHYVDVNHHAETSTAELASDAGDQLTLADHVPNGFVEAQGQGNQETDEFEANQPHSDTYYVIGKPVSYRTHVTIHGDYLNNTSDAVTLSGRVGSDVAIQPTDLPSITGYTVSDGESTNLSSDVIKAHLNPSDFTWAENAEPMVYYRADPQQVTVNYVDANDQPIRTGATQTLNGVTNQPLNFDDGHNVLVIPTGYAYDNGVKNNPNGYVFKAGANQPLTVHVKGASAAMTLNYINAETKRPVGHYVDNGATGSTVKFANHLPNGFTLAPNQSSSAVHNGSNQTENIAVVGTSLSQQAVSQLQNTRVNVLTDNLGADNAPKQTVKNLASDFLGHRVGETVTIDPSTWALTGYQLDPKDSIGLNGSDQLMGYIDNAHHVTWQDSGRQVPLLHYAADPESVTVNYVDQNGDPVGSQQLSASTNYMDQFKAGQNLTIPAGYRYNSQFRNNPNVYRFSTSNSPITVHVVGSANSLNGQPVDQATERVTFKNFGPQGDLISSRTRDLDIQRYDTDYHRNGNQVLIGDHFVINASDFTPRGYSNGYRGTDTRVSGVIADDGLQPEHGTLAYTAGNIQGQTVINVHLINVNNRGAKQDVADYTLSGKDEQTVNVLPRHVPAGFTLQPRQQSHYQIGLVPKAVNLTLVGNPVHTTATIPANVYNHAGQKLTTTTNVTVNGWVGDMVNVGDGQLAIKPDLNFDNAGTDYSGHLASDTLTLTPTGQDAGYRVDWQNGQPPTAVYTAYHGMVSSATSTANVASGSASQSGAGAAISSGDVSTVANPIATSNASLGTDYYYLSSVAANHVNRADASMQADVAKLSSDWGTIQSASTAANSDSEAVNGLINQINTKENAVKSIINHNLAHDYTTIARNETDRNANMSANSTAASQAADDAKAKLGTVTADSNAIGNLQNQIKADLTKANQVRAGWNQAKTAIGNLLTKVNNRVNTDDTNWRNLATEPQSLKTAVASAKADSQAATRVPNYTKNASQSITTARRSAKAVVDTMSGWINQIKQNAPHYDSMVDASLISSAASTEASVSTAAGGIYSQIGTNSGALSNEIMSLTQASASISAMSASVSTEYQSASSASVVASNSANSTESSGVISGEQTASSAASAAQSSLASLNIDRAALDQANNSMKNTLASVANDDAALSAVQSYMSEVSSAALSETAGSYATDIDSASSVVNYASRNATIDSSLVDDQSSAASGLITNIKTQYNNDRSIMRLIGINDNALNYYIANATHLVSDINRLPSDVQNTQNRIISDRSDVRTQLNAAKSADRTRISGVLKVLRDELQADNDRLDAERAQAQIYEDYVKAADDYTRLQDIDHAVMHYLDNM